MDDCGHRRRGAEDGGMKDGSKGMIEEEDDIG